MNADKLRLEIHLETKELPRDRVARIIWLHADELAAEPSPTPQTPASTRVQALRSDGVRMTFQAQQVAAGTVSGKSDILGTCRVSLKDVDQLVVGQAIEQYAARLAYQQWKLHNAIEPKVMDSTGADGGGGRPTGADSALVGKPAPDFTLELLRGGKFHLAGAKGKIVIVDFWATWCGPCLQAMPQIDKVAHEFADKGVQVVAVNLEETPQPITSMLERHKLEMPVALDHDGVVAAKYGVTSIPQTLIVDREGNVVRHYIGGGPHLGEDVTAALRELLGEAAKPQPSGN